MLEKADKLARAGNFKDAEALYAKLVKDKPRNATVLQTVITFHNRYSRKYRAAVPYVQALVALKPKSAQAHAVAAETYCNCARPFLAQPHADQAVSLAPDDADCLFVAAVTMMQINRFDQAMDYLDRALSARPDHAPSLLQKGRALRNTGQLDEATEVARILLARNPDDLNALELYFSTTQIAADDPVFVDVRDRILPACEKLGGAVLTNILHLIGKAQNDQRDFGAAFDSFARAKTARGITHDSAGYANFLSAMVNRISKDDFTAGGNPSQQPLLIVGMPRSGSTLLEQILTGHSQIDSAGESPSLNIMVQDIGVRKHQGPALAQAIKQIPAEAVTQLSGRYLTQIGTPGDNTYTIDKNLHNFELLGFFAKLFPNAPIIHTIRDPLDTCVSCYMQPLSAWHSYTQDQTALGRYYLQYRRLMDHWAAVLPNPMLTVPYETLIADPKSTASGVTDFLKLDWEDNCLDFQTTTNTSATLSTWAVRQPLNTRSIARWQRYDDRIGPLKSALAPLYPDGFTKTGGQ
ncbi:tetratricopeptide repeat-containing sulfotransferase family protein [Yoonia sp. 208BN28-4]|uniref:tetratricopeptide repeat-containing sulfotransferase family protein n=1 Tax=Yoonia sp. 208BN28-4 TaxID=3126505 RepID=UPI0030B56FBD